MSPTQREGNSRSRLDAVLFDMDGVITDTAIAHAASWKQLFDGYLAELGGNIRPFAEADYRELIDGKPRLDGIRSFLRSRGLTLPEGAETDGGEAGTVHGLGARKNRLFTAWLEENAVEAFPGTLALLDQLDAAGIKAAVFSSSRNAEAVLRSAGVLDRFATKVDGVDMASLGLPGKPDPAILHETARRLGVEPGRTAVVEDALSGVRAGAAGGFALVVGVDRDGDGGAHREAGADLVVGDLAELRADAEGIAVRTLVSTPAALPEASHLRDRLAGRRPAVFLDYDGVLSPIVPDPKDAVLREGMRGALARLAEMAPVAIVSGRDLDDVRSFVGDERLFFAGSHGFDLAGPNGWRETIEKGRAFLPALDAAARDLEAALAPIGGARLERKRFSLAVHFRHVAAADEPRLAGIVRDTMARHPELKAAGGKKVYDVKPRVDWHKGRAVLALLGELGLDRPDVLPIYLGDDTTDEDAFRSLSLRGLGLVVRDGADRRTAARYALNGTEEVERFLRWLADELESRGAA